MGLVARLIGTGVLGAVVIPGLVTQVLVKRRPSKLEPR